MVQAMILLWFITIMTVIFYQSDVKKMCNRRFGVGADGLIIVEKTLDADFKMIYYNADGFVGSMCGNGARCAVSFVKNLIDSKYEFYPMMACIKE